METKELLKRIEAARARKGWSPRRASMIAGLGPDFLRNLAGGRVADVKASKLKKLALALDVPPAYFIDGDLDSSPVRPADPVSQECWRRAEMVAKRAVESLPPGEQRDEIEARVTATAYSLICERTRAGESFDDPKCLDLLDAVIRHMVLSSL
jgi:transcriptional regulator with XRE-family HTH domain